MPQKTSIDFKLLAVLAVIILAIISVVYYTTHREVTDARGLSIRAINALEDTDSYRFTISTNLSMHGEELELLSGGGSVDYRNKKLCTSMTMTDRTVEMVAIGDTAYVRESNESWQTQDISGYSSSVWESDQLAQQRSILHNATNVTMQKEAEGWILDIVPDKANVVEQMKKTGMETLKEEELKDFAIMYWIEKGSYHITKIENRVALEMNIQGLVTPVELDSVVYLDGYNEKVEIEAPIGLIPDMMQ